MDATTRLLFLLCLSSVSALILPLTKSNGDPDLSSILNHVTLMEQTIATLQADVKATNTKLQTTENELMTVKGKLQTAEDELVRVRTDLTTAENDIAVLKHDLQKGPDPVELTNMKNEFDALKNSVLQPINLTDVITICADVNNLSQELAEVKSQIVTDETKQNTTNQGLTATKTLVQSTSAEVKTVKSQINSINGDINAINQDLAAITNKSDESVAFQVTQRGLGSKVWTTLKFDTVDYSTGGGYDNTTGMFTAPVSGAYLFWVSVLLNSPAGAHEVYINKGQQKLAIGFYTTTDNDSGVPSTMAVTHLDKGDQVHFTTLRTSADINGFGRSSYGGVLLHAT